jgi:hypothetical protein
MKNALLGLVLLILFLASSCESYPINWHPSGQDILKENDAAPSGERP